MTVLFDAQVASLGSGGYAFSIHPERIQQVDDPLAGPQRQVLRYSVYDADINPTENPRAQCETPQQFAAGADIYIGWSMLLPAGFPTTLPTNDIGNFITLSEMFGPPYAGSSPCRFGTRAGQNALVLQRNVTYGFDTIWASPTIVTDLWYDFVWRVKLSTDPAVGFYELSMNTGAGWAAQTLTGGGTRLASSTIDASDNGGPSYHALKLYRTRGLYPVVSCYYADHKVATTFAEAAPARYAAPRTRYATAAAAATYAATYGGTSPAAATTTTQATASSSTVSHRPGRSRTSPQATTTRSPGPASTTTPSTASSWSARPTPTSAPARSSTTAPPGPASATASTCRAPGPPTR